MFGRFTIKALVASSCENSPEDLSVLERPIELFSSHNDDKGNIRLFSKCKFLLSCVKYQKVLTEPITISIGTYVIKINDRQMHHSYLPEWMNYYIRKVYSFSNAVSKWIEKNIYLF